MQGCRECSLLLMRNTKQQGRKQVLHCTTHRMWVADDLAVLARHLRQRHWQRQARTFRHIAANVGDFLQQEDVGPTGSTVRPCVVAAGPEHAHHHADDLRRRRQPAH